MKTAVLFVICSLAVVIQEIKAYIFLCNLCFENKEYSKEGLKLCVTVQPQACRPGFCSVYTTRP